MVVYADEDGSTELERKVAALRVVCLIETVSYLILSAFWIYWLVLGGSKLLSQFRRSDQSIDRLG